MTGVPSLGKKLQLLANPADLAGKVSVTGRVDSAEGFDKDKLHNGVLEPAKGSRPDRIGKRFKHWDTRRQNPKR